MGAWIEIVPKLCDIPDPVTVAPLVGAWIEIGNRFVLEADNCVAPLVGAWIEICRFRSAGSGGLGRSPRGSVD